MSAEAARSGPLARETTRIETRWIHPAIPLAAAAVAFAWTLYGDMRRIYGLTGPAWDLGYDQQVVWNITQGQGFYSSFARGDFLGIHLEPILVVMAAFEKVWPSPVVLLIFASAGLAASGPAAYLFFRAMLPAGRADARWLAVALAAPVPFWVGVQEAARDFFHPENMAFAFAMLAAWAGLRGHRVAMWTLCVLTLTCKEDQVYTIGVVALLMRSFAPEHIRKHWRFVLYLAGAWFLVGTGIVQQHLRDDGYTDFVYYRWLVGLDPTAPVSAAAVLGALVRPLALLMVAILIASLAGLPLLAPRWLVLVIPPYLANVLSGHTAQYFLQNHYTLLLLFPLTVAAAVGARRYVATRTLRPRLVIAVAAIPVALGFVAGRFPPGLQSNPELYSRPNSVERLETATAVIPANAPVNADPALTIWLANRHQINDFPDMLDASCYVVIDREAFLSGPTHPDERANAITALPTSGRRLLYDDGRFQVWSPVGD